MFNLHFVVPDQPPRLDEPAEGALDDPPLGQYLEPFHVVAAFHNFELHLPVAVDAGNLLRQFPAVASVSPNEFQPAVGVFQQVAEQSPGPIAILNVRSGNLKAEQVALRVYQDVPLSSCNFLTRIITTNSGLASCANALAVKDRSRRGFFFPLLRRALSRRASWIFFHQPCFAQSLK